LSGRGLHAKKSKDFAAEILKSQTGLGMRKELYHFRDQQGLEVVLVPMARAGLWLIEAKVGKTVRPAIAAPLISLSRFLPTPRKRLLIVHRRSRSLVPISAVAPGVEALDVERFITELN